MILFSICLSACLLPFLSLPVLLQSGMQGDSPAYHQGLCPANESVCEFMWLFHFLVTFSCTLASHVEAPYRSGVRLCHCFPQIASKSFCSSRLSCLAYWSQNKTSFSNCSSYLHGPGERREEFYKNPSCLPLALCGQSNDLNEQQPVVWQRGRHCLPWVLALREIVNIIVAIQRSAYHVLFLYTTIIMESTITNFIMICCLLFLNFIVSYPLQKPNLSCYHYYY